MSPHIIRGWFTEIRSSRGRDGTRIPASGLAARISRSAPGSESATLAVLGGDGLTGDSIGITDTQSTTTTGITLAAAHFITAIASTEVQALAAEHLAAATQGTGLSTGTSAGVAEFTTVPAHPPDRSMETRRRLEDMLRPAARAAPARGPSVAMTMADKPGVFLHAAAPALVAEARVAEEELGAAVDLTAVAGIVNRDFGMFLCTCKS